METNKTPKQKSFFQSNTAKLILIAFLTIFLLIPLNYVENLISKRKYRQADVISEISEKWGEDIYIYGPIIKVPYTSYTETISINETTKKETREKITSLNYAYFFPEELKINANIDTKVLSRNNYDAAVFTSKMHFDGNYIQPDFSSQDIKKEDVHWDKATILIQTTNLKSIKNQAKIKLGNESYTFEPVYNSNKKFENNREIETLETGYIDLNKMLTKTNINFNFDITYNGSEQIKIVPIGKTTITNMKSNWSSPSFTGNFLPDDKTKKINNDGFEANWKILHINRAFSQQTFNDLPDLQKYSFGVNFVVPIDQYQQNERASKYGILILGLTFLIFFLIQNLSKISIHIFQYFMIGLALIMFYTLLISITEHSNFTKAYLISGISVVALITTYSISIIKNKKFPLFICLSLTGLYTFIYIIIQLENYALLVGSIGLFIILATIMYFSRNIDWSK